MVQTQRTDRTITLPDETGTLITTGATDLISETMMANDAISQNELKDVVTLVIYNSSGTPVKTLYAYTRKNDLDYGSKNTTL